MARADDGRAALIDWVGGEVVLCSIEWDGSKRCVYVRTEEAMAFGRMDGISKAAAAVLSAYNSESGIGSGQSRMHVKRSVVDHQLFSLEAPSHSRVASDAGLATPRMRWCICTM